MGCAQSLTAKDQANWWKKNRPKQSVDALPDMAVKLPFAIENFANWFTPQHILEEDRRYGPAWMTLAAGNRRQMINPSLEHDTENGAQNLRNMFFAFFSDQVKEAIVHDKLTRPSAVMISGGQNAD